MFKWHDGQAITHLVTAIKAQRDGKPFNMITNKRAVIEMRTRMHIARFPGNLCLFWLYFSLHRHILIQCLGEDEYTKYLYEWAESKGLAKDAEGKVVLKSSEY